MKAKQELCSEIHFCQRSGMSKADTIQHLRCVHGNQVLCDSSIRRWYAVFASGSDRIQDAPQTRQPKKCTAAVIQNTRRVLDHNRKQTVRQVAGQIGLSVSATHTLLRKDLNMKKLTASWIPHLLTTQQKAR